MCASLSRLPARGFVAVCLLLAGCAGAPAERPVDTSRRVDFSGAWEVDYSQSESVSEAYDRLVSELERQVRRQAQSMGQAQGPLVSVAPAYATGEGLYALARMAEVVTEPQLLDIRQGATDISVKREGSFALECDFSQGAGGTRESPFGREVCAWQDHQLVFQVALPDGLVIRHRLTLAPDGQRLQLVTQLISGQVSQPFAVSQVYNRYDPERSGISCTQTLSKGKVCTTERPTP